MTSVRQYVSAMRQRELTIGLALGSDLTGADMRVRVMNTALLSMIGTLAKVIVDNGVATDAQLAGALDAAIAEAWPAEPDSGSS